MSWSGTHMETAIRPELAHDPLCGNGYLCRLRICRTDYAAAKSVVADYFGVVDGQPHTVTVSDSLRWLASPPPSATATRRTAAP